MIDFEKMNDNPLSRRWKKKYNEQPEHIRKKIDELDEKDLREYQLKVIKRKRAYPQKGDIFIVNPIEGVYFSGIVVNNYVSNINGDDWLVIMIFRSRMKEVSAEGFVADFNNLLIEPCIVDKGYWTRGYFYTVGNNIECLEGVQYGFYDILDGIYCDEYGKELQAIPSIFGTFGVSTISGVASKINKELIIDETLLS